MHRSDENDEGKHLYWERRVASGLPATSFPRGAVLSEMIGSLHAEASLGLQQQSKDNLVLVPRQSESQPHTPHSLVDSNIRSDREVRRDA